MGDNGEMRQETCRFTETKTKKWLPGYRVTGRWFLSKEQEISHVVLGESQLGSLRIEDPNLMVYISGTQSMDCNQQSLLQWF
jgi:hypothetical protein